MKKSLSKLPVMVTLVVLAVALLGVYIFMLARPVAYGMEYTHTYDKTEEALATAPTLTLAGVTKDSFKELTVKTSYKFLNGKQVETTMHVDYELKKDVAKETKTAVEKAVKELNKAKGKSYYLRYGDKVMSAGSTKAEYEAAKKAFDKLSKKEKETASKAYILEVNAFTAKTPAVKLTKTEAVTFTCAGEIVWAVVLGVVEVALVAFAALSVVYYVGSKKHA